MVCEHLKICLPSAPLSKSSRNSRMKKLLVGLAIPVGLVVFGAPYLSGKVAESEIRRLIDQVNQSPLEYGSTEIVSYERGFRSTEATYRYTLSPALRALGNAEPIDFVCLSEHGVTSIEFSCNIDGDNVYTRFVGESLQGKDPLSMNGSVSVFGEINQTLAVDVIENFPSSSGSLTLAKTDLTISTDQNFSSYEILGSSGGFSLVKDLDKVTVGKVHFDGDLSESDEGLFLGEFRIDVADMTTTSGDGTFEVKGLSLVTGATKNGENTDSTMSVLVNEINTIDSPFKTIQGVDLSLTVNGINTAALVEYQDFADQLRQDMLVAKDADSDANVALARSLEVIPIFEKMLDSDLFIEASLAANYDQQPASLNVSVDMLESIAFQELQMLIVAPQEILSRLDIKASSSISKELVDSQAMFTSLVAQNPLFELSSGKYSSDLILGKETTLNGDVISLEELQALLIPSQPQ